MFGWLKTLIQERSGPLPYGRTSYAQEGEDLALEALLADPAPGFYVDVGSHHPFRFSNTYRFYRQGWSGICIDPLPGTKELFRRWRGRDQAVEIGVASEAGLLDYYMFEEPALNTFCQEVAAGHTRERSCRLVEVRQVRVNSLASILRQVMPTPRTIDFLSIDVEGLDLVALQSNDWASYRPRMVLAECRHADLLELRRDPTVRYLVDLGYQPRATTGRTVLFTAASGAPAEGMDGDRRCEGVCNGPGAVP